MTKTVLVTGASGFLATYVVKAFLDAGWNVRGSVRDKAKAQHLLDMYPDEAKLTLVEVKDIVTGEGLDEAMKGVDAVAHTASPYALTVKDPMKDFLTPAVDGTLSVLRAAKKAGIKRVALTSSFAAVTNLPLGGPWRDYTYTDADWNPTTKEQACEEGRPGAFVYSASKTLAEHAAHDYAKDNGMEVVALNPPMIYGTPLQRIQDSSSVNTSSNAIYTLIRPSVHKNEVPGNRLPLFCSVEDVALAHVKAVEAPSDKVIYSGESRYLLCGGSFTWEDAIEHLRTARPELASRLPTLPDQRADKAAGPLAKLDCTRAHELLGMPEFETWKPVLERTIDALVEAEKIWEKKE